MKNKKVLKKIQKEINDLESDLCHVWSESEYRSIAKELLFLYDLYQKEKESYDNY